MTRINLLKAIYDNAEDWSCAYSCPHTMEEQDPQKVCMECANRLLTEYERKIRAEIFNEIMPILIDIVDKEGCCYGYEQEIDRLECEWEQLKEK